jgi:hypothetical protein
MPEIIKICKMCGPLTIDKTRTEKNSIYLRIECLFCRRQKQILNRRKISKIDYDFLFEKQENKCAICRKEELLISRGGHVAPLCVDHCHLCNSNRGLLCHDCNTSIGRAKDNISILQSAIDYLKKHNHVENNL